MALLHGFNVHVQCIYMYIAVTDPEYLTFTDTFHGVFLYVFLSLKKKSLKRNTRI